MSALVDRITAVLREHSANECWWKCDGGTYWTEAAHAAHVAERIAEALNLKEETMTGWADDDVIEQHRWASPWTAVEGKP